MSRLDDLIKNLCPDGVKCYNLGAIAELRSGWGFPVKEQGNKIAEIPFYKVADMNNSLIFMGEASNYVTHETAQKLKCNPAPKGTIIFPKVGATIRTDKKRIIVTDSCYDNNIMGVIAKESIVNSKYLYYYLSKVPLITFAKGEGAVPSISKESLSNFKLPIPPLEVQKEIVRLLDDFTAKTAELQAELNKEYEARKKQHDFYRNSMLNNFESVKYIPLRSIVKKSCSGGTPKKSKTEYYEKGNIPWIRTQDIKFNEIFDVDGRITETAVEETSVKWIPENCVIVAISGATAGRCAINKFRATTNQHCLNLEINDTVANYKYVFYAICNQQEDLISKKQGARGDLNSSLVLNMQIPVPSLEVQNRIVDMLNNLEETYGDLQSILSTELESRQKQYEFYRDKLLTFKELNESEVN